MRGVEALLHRDFPGPARRGGTLGGVHGGGARGRARLAASVGVAAWLWRTWLTCPCFVELDPQFSFHARTRRRSTTAKQLTFLFCSKFVFFTRFS